MSQKTSIAFCLVFLISCSLNGQSGTDEPVIYPGGISLECGFGSYALKDNNISPERYEGMLPYYSLDWTRSHKKYVYKLGFYFSQSDDINNYDVSTRILNYKLSQGFLYPLKPFTLFNRELGLWIGPTTDIFYYDNNPEIAASGFDFTNSYAALISLGFRGDAIYPISDRFSMKSSLQFSVISLGIRTVDSVDDEQSGTKPLTFASGLNGSFNLGMHYNLFSWLSMGLSYRFELTRITAWEDMLSVTNSAVLGMYFRF